MNSLFLRRRGPLLSRLDMDTRTAVLAGMLIPAFRPERNRKETAAETGWGINDGERGPPYPRGGGQSQRIGRRVDDTASSTTRGGENPAHAHRQRLRGEDHLQQVLLKELLDKLLPGREAPGVVGGEAAQQRLRGAGADGGRVRVLREGHRRAPGVRSAGISTHGV